MTKIRALTLFGLILAAASYAADTTTTPLMSLVLPVPGARTGPNWANDINTAFQTVDTHDHTSGKGSRVPSAGLNINADLSFGGYNATTQRACRFSSQTGTLTTGNDKNQIYVVNGDLYFNDASGTAIRITSSGSLDASGFGSISGMGGTGAAATYSNTTKTFTLTQSSGVTAKLATGDISLFENVASANPITLKSPASLAASYTWTLPAALPAATKFLAVSSTGQLANDYGLDNSTLEVSGSTIQIKDSGVVTAKLADGSVTQAKRVALGQQISSSSGTWTTASTSFTDVTNLSVSITTTGRPVRVELIPDGTTSGSSVGVQYVNTDTGTAYFSFVKNGTAISNAMIDSSSNTSATEVSGEVYVPCGSISTIDTPSAGAYTYKLQARSTSPSTTTAVVTRCKLIAYEL